MTQPDQQPDRAVGVLIPQFPTQTHVAMWRVAESMRRLGVRTHLLSTRRPEPGRPCHDALVEEATRTFYAWPPRWGGVMAWLATHLGGMLASLRYVLRLKEESPMRKLKLLALLVSAANLARFCRDQRIEHVFVHSCADAAHLVAIARRIGGPAYSLRLGGDLDVYGGDHAAKMAGATLVAAAAENNRQEVIERIGLPEDRVITLPLGVDTRRFTPSMQHQAAIGEAGRLKLVSVSRLHPRKGLDDVLRAVAIAKDRGVRVEYAMVGDGPSRGELESLVQELGLSDRVAMPGAQGEDQIVQTLRSAEVFVLASHGAGEGSPVAMIEAMACGLAVVSTRVGGTPDMVADGVDGLLVDQREPEQLAAALVRLANNPQERGRIGRAARQTAEQRYDVLSVGRLLLNRFGLTPRPAIGHDQPTQDCPPATAAARAGGRASA